ncbi:MAG TPA: hypothetical protein VFI49_14695 [Rudaea sp.]|nr:hypothetical protein [Rudaea sp.]
MKTEFAGSPLANPPDFSLILGGPLYQLLRRAHLSGDALELLTRRVTVLSLLTWLPLLVLSVAQGHAWGNSVKVPFLFDVDVHARFLLALPLFVVAEIVVHQRMRPVVAAFLKRGLIPDAARAKFDAAISAAMRMRNSIMAEVLLIVFVYGVGVLVVWRNNAAIDVATWYSESGGGRLQPTWAGWWFGLVSLPVFQFILLRWYFRLVIWARFLWQVSRIDLHLIPTHPDRSGGLGFLSIITQAFAPLLAGQGVVLAGVMANKIFYAGGKLVDFKMEIVALVAVMIFFVIAPLLVFLPLLARTKRAGLSEYGGLAQRYVREFDQKWLRGGAPADELLVGSADVQSLADMGNSFEVVKGMRLVPFGKDMVVQLAVISLVPVAPLILTMIPLGQLLDRFLQIVV